MLTKGAGLLIKKTLMFACVIAGVACTSTRGWGFSLVGPGWDGVLLPHRDPSVWLAAVEPLLDQPELLQEMGRRAQQAVETQIPSWEQVLEEDLLPVWRQSALDPW